jgi:PPP family 3-phenylpropionic acid transporter
MSDTLPSHKRVSVMYCLLQMGYWGMMAAFSGYQTAIVLDRGFSSGAAGTFSALGCLSGIVSQPVLGGWADRHPGVPLKRIFGGCLLLALGVQAAFYLTRPGFGWTAAIFLALGILETNAYPFMDSMAMQYINVGMDVPYSLGRGLGSFSYAVVCVLVGQQTARFGIETALLTHAGLLGFMLLILAAFPTFPHRALPSERERRAPHSAGYLLKTNKPFTLILIGGFFGMAAVLPIVNFLVKLVGDRGGDNRSLGIALFLMAASELPAAFLFQKLRKKFDNERILLISLVFMMLKPLACLASRSLLPLLLVQPIQMLGYGLFTPASVYFTNESVAREDRVRGQSLKAVLTCGLGGVIGNLICGFVIDWGGPDAMLIVCAFSGAAGIAFGAWAIRARARAVQTA